MRTIAELYRNPGAKFLGAGELPVILEQFDRLSTGQKLVHFIKYKDKNYVGEDVEKLKIE